MKKLIFTIALILMSYSMLASPADMTPFKVMQPNGDSIIIITRWRN